MPPATARIPHAQRVVALLAIATGAAVVANVLRPGVVTDDTYAFLVWGRSLWHGSLPLLEHRTFQPLPILVGAVLSLFGSATPTITVLLSLVCLLVLAAAAWRIVELLGFGQPAPALAAAFVLTNPILPVLAFVVYNNLQFATAILWAFVFELEGRWRRTWILLVLAGFLRPEAWAFLAVYGALTWWRAGRPLLPRRLLPLAALALGPMLVWVLLEWALFGDALYSLHNTTGAAVMNTHTGSLGVLWQSLQDSMTRTPLIASAVGAVAIAWLSPRHRAATTLALVSLAAVTILILAGSKFNVPTRHFSVLIALLCPLAAIGAVAPGQLLERFRPSAAGVAMVLRVAGALAVAALAGSHLVDGLRGESRSLDMARTVDRTLVQSVDRARPLIDTHSARRHSVAILDAPETSALAWSLDVAYNVVNGEVVPQTRLIVQPSQPTWVLVRRGHIVRQSRSRLPHGWHLVLGGDWNFYARDGHAAVALH